MASEADWRRGYHEQIYGIVTQYKAWRDDPRTTKRVVIPGTWRTKSVRELTESEMFAIACREAESDMNYAINQEAQRKR